MSRYELADFHPEDGHLHTCPERPATCDCAAWLYCMAHDAEMTVEYGSPDGPAAVVSSPEFAQTQNGALLSRCCRALMQGFGPMVQCVVCKQVAAIWNEERAGWDPPTNESLAAASHAQPLLSVTETNDASTASPTSTNTPSPLREKTK